MGVAQLAIVVSIGTTIAMIIAFTSAMKEMSVSAEKLEEQRREERREEVLRMEAREDQKEAREERRRIENILLFVAVAAVYFIKN